MIQESNRAARSPSHEERLERAWASVAKSFSAKRTPASDKLNLSTAQYHTLRFVCERHSVRMTELAQALGTAESTATRMIDKLVRDGLVTRHAEELDRRSVSVRATKRGRALFTTARRLRIEDVALVLRPLEPSEREHLCRLFEKLATGATSSEGKRTAPPSSRALRTLP